MPSSIGANSFEEIVEQSFYVDKTLLIKAITNSTYQSMLLTYPRKWGKTVNLQMMKSFFSFNKCILDDKNVRKHFGIFQDKKIIENDIICYQDIAYILQNFIESDKDKIIKLFQLFQNLLYPGFSHQEIHPSIEHQITTLKKLFEEAISLFSDSEVPLNLQELKEEDIKNYFNSSENSTARRIKGLLHFGDISKFYNKVTVIYIQSEENYWNIDLLISSWRKLISKLFDDFSYVTETLKGYGLSTYEQFRKDHFKNLSVSLYFLVEIIHNFHQTKVIILVDGYERQIIKSAGTSMYQESIDFFTNVFTDTLKDNSRIHFSLLSGTTKVPFESFFSGLDNFHTFRIFDNYLSSFYGFTQSELDTIIKKCNENMSQKQISPQLMKENYYSYLQGTNYVYNPFSVIQCIKGAMKTNIPTYKFHWKNSGNISILLYYLEFQTYLLYPYLHSAQMKLLVLFLKGLCALISQHKDTSGYLTQLDTNITLKFEESKEYCFVIPNKEVKSAFYDIHKVVIQKMFNYQFDEFRFEYIEEDLDKIGTLDKSITTYFLDHINGVLFQESQLSINKSNLQWLFFSHLALTPRMRFHIFKDKRLKELKKCYHLLTPMESSHLKTAIINEYKIIKQKYAPHQLEDVMWQIFEKDYISIILNNPSRDQWEFVILRAVVFFRNDNAKWEVIIKEKKIQIRVLEELSQKFTIFQNELKEKQECGVCIERNQFIESFNLKGINALFDLLQRYQYGFSLNNFKLMNKRQRTIDQYFSSLSNSIKQSNGKKKLKTEGESNCQLINEKNSNSKDCEQEEGENEYQQKNIQGQTTLILKNQLYML